MRFEMMCQCSLVDVGVVEGRQGRVPVQYLVRYSMVVCSIGRRGVIIINGRARETLHPPGDYWTTAVSVRLPITKSGSIPSGGDKDEI